MKDYELLPADIYPAVISSVKKEPTKSGNGDALKLIFEVLEGKYKNRKVFCTLCLWHTSEWVRKKASEKRDELLEVTNNQNIPKLSNLYGSKLNIKVDIEGNWNVIEEFIAPNPELFTEEDDSDDSLPF